MLTPSSSRRAPLARPWFFAMATMLILRSCGGTTPIKTLLDDPSRFDGKTVRIAGDVESSIGILGVGGYKVNDGTGTLPVVTESGGTPRNGARVGVEGTFHSAFTLGGTTAAVLVEKRRYTP